MLIGMQNQFQIYPNLSQITGKFKGILLDAYGVFWGGNELGLLPKAKESMRQLVADGKIVGILSNTTQLATKEIQKFRSHGILQEEHFHFFVSSGEVARDQFLNHHLPFPTPQKKFWVFGEIHPRFSSHAPIFQGTSYMETADIDHADFIYVAIPHIQGVDQTDPQAFYAQLLQIKEKNLPLVCSNPDRFAHEGLPPKAVVRQGSIAALYENMGGCVHYIGKPYSQAFSFAMSNFEKKNIFNRNEILMVGDTPETDIRGARQFGMASALITQTGMMAERIFHEGLESALQSLAITDQPDYLIKQFAYDI